MQFIPAIDIIAGKCVRLFQGDYNQKKDYGFDPVKMAESFFLKGVKRLHIVDLDGARTGKLQNVGKIIEIIKKFPEKIIEIGGGIRDEKSLAFYIDHGAAKVILGSKGVGDRLFLQEMTTKYPDQVILGVDIRDGRISVEGWTKDSGVEVIDFLSQLANKKIFPEIIFTDIKTDGTLTGPPLDLIKKICIKFPFFKFIASGGIANLADVENIISLKLTNLIGMISGKAIYENKIDINEALRVCV